MTAPYRNWQHHCRSCEVTWRGDRADPCWLCGQPAIVAVPIVEPIYDFSHYQSSGVLCPEDLWMEHE